MKTRSKSSSRVRKKTVTKKKVTSTARKKKTTLKSVKKKAVKKKTQKAAPGKTVKKTVAKKKVTSTARKKKATAIKKPRTAEPALSITRETVISVSATMPGGGLAVPPPSGQLIGKVTHYYNHSSVAIIELDAGNLRVGDTIHIKGHTTDFEQVVESIQIEHQNVETAGAGQTVGVKVREMVREHDRVYKKD